MSIMHYEVSSRYVCQADKTPTCISSRTTEFIRGVERKVLKLAPGLDARPLKELLWYVSKHGVTPIEGELYKKSGYFARWFSENSWEDWAENRTPLGRVISMYCDHVTTKQPLKASVSRVDQKVLEVANREAAAILKSLRAEKELSSKQNEVLTRSFWSSFLTLPMAEAAPLSRARFPAEFELSSLNGNNGFILDGENGWDNSGATVSRAGDINGDGIDDFTIGAPGASPNNKTNAGRGYVIFGSHRGWSSPINLRNLSFPMGFMIDGEYAGDFSSYSITGAGDINNDGIADLVIGAVAARGERGECYVIFGKKGNWSSPFELLTLNGTNGFRINAEDGAAGASVSGAGDINGDGVDDFVLGAPYASPGNRHKAGKTYVIFGHRGLWDSSIDLSGLNGTNGFVLHGENADYYSGLSVSSAGDINADGVADIVVGAPFVPLGGTVGKGYVIFGHKGSWNSPIELSSMNGKNGFTFIGDGSNDSTGSSVSGAGDINGDGISDVVVGAPRSLRNEPFFAGKTYVIFGRPGSWSTPLQLSNLNGQNGFAINGAVKNAAIGSSVSGVGDINGDGVDDLITSSPYFSQSFVVFGSKGSWTTPFELSSLNGINGFTLQGETTYDIAGSSVSGAGDINGDGIADLIIGAPDATANNEPQAGKSYVVFGQKHS